MHLLDALRLPGAPDGAELDGPDAARHHACIIRQKPMLRALYTDFYRRIASRLPADSNRVVEIGSGGGFIKEIIPNATTSDVQPLADVDMCFSATSLPFDAASLDAITMINVLHHVPDPRAFLREATRCLKTGGRVLMIEPANTLWSRFVYSRFHHEPFNPTAGWSFESSGPMSSANGALPWIIFCRDRIRFEREFPALRIREVRPHTPLRYVLSGGLSFRQLVPGIFAPLVCGAELILAPVNRWLGMFLLIDVEKTA